MGHRLMTYTTQLIPEIISKLTFVFLLVFTLFDALVCLINLVIWRLHFKIIWQSVLQEGSHGLFASSLNLERFLDEASMFPFLSDP
jgi:hypothetical protein